MSQVTFACCSASFSALVYQEVMPCYYQPSFGEPFRTDQPRASSFMHPSQCRPHEQASSLATACVQCSPRAYQRAYPKIAGGVFFRVEGFENQLAPCLRQREWGFAAIMSLHLLQPPPMACKRHTSRVLFTVVTANEGAGISTVAIFFRRIEAAFH